MNNQNSSLPTSPHLSLDNSSPPKQFSPNFGNPNAFYGHPQDQITAQQFFHPTQGFQVPLFGTNTPHQQPQTNNGQPPPSMQALNAYQHQINAYNMYQQQHHRSSSYPAAPQQQQQQQQMQGAAFAPGTINPQLISPTLDNTNNSNNNNWNFFPSPNIDASQLQLLDENARSTKASTPSGTNSKRYSHSGSAAASLRTGKSGQTPPASSKAPAATSLAPGSKAASSGDNLNE
jgi:hypothetical protein